MDSFAPKGMSYQRGQSRLMSMIEANVNLVVAFGISWFAQVYLVSWLLEIQISGRQGAGIVLLFSVLSFIRQFVLRRIFNYIEVRRGR